MNRESFHMKKQYKAVFRIQIDLRESKEMLRPLRPGQVYYLENHQNFSYNDIATEAERIIDNELKTELQKYTNLSIKDVRTQSLYEGSIEIIFTVILGFLELIGGLNNLYDAVHMIAEITKRHINKRLSDKYGNYFRVDTYVISPNEHLLCYSGRRYMTAQESNGEIKRDTFFYYLLVANIVLLIIIGILVFEAIKTVYF